MSIQNMTLLDFTWYFKYTVGIRTATLDGQPGICPPWNFQNHVSCYRYNINLHENSATASCNHSFLHENSATASCNHSFSKIVSLFWPCWALSFLYKMGKNLTM